MHASTSPPALENPSITAIPNPRFCVLRSTRTLGWVKEIFWAIDQVWSIAQNISLTHPRVRVLRRTQNRGLGMAVIDGFSNAGGDVLACIDADLQHDPSILPRML